MFFKIRSCHVINIFVIMSLGFTSLTSGQVIGPGKCNPVQTQEDFDISKYLGTWYEVRRYPFMGEENERCITAKYSGPMPDGHVRVENSGIFKNNGSLDVGIGDGYAPDPKDPARLKARASETSPYGDYWILETDYIGYSLVYSCAAIPDKENTKIEFMWMLSRERVLAKNIVERLIKLLETYGVKRNLVQVTDQNNC